MAKDYRQYSRATGDNNPAVIAGIIRGNIDSGVTEKELRAAYSAMRKTANRRLVNLAKSEFSRSKSVRYNAGRFKTLNQITSPEEFAHLYADLTRFLNSKQSSVTAMRETRRQQLESLHDLGYTGITRANFGEFMEFMDVLRALGVANALDSDEAYELFTQSKERRISNDELVDALADFAADKRMHGVRLKDLAPLSADTLLSELGF